MPATSQLTVYTVNGIIYDEYDSSLQNVNVKVFDKDLRTEKLLGEQSTDAKGHYQVSFNSILPDNPEHKTADLLIKVFNGNGQLLGQSPIYFNVAEHTTINYKVGNTVYKGTNEFDALLQLLQPIVESNQVWLGILQENEEIQDYTFLAGETGEDSVKIAFINTAFRLSKETPIAPDIFYGLFRMSFPVELNALLLIKADSIIKALKQAIAENIISSKWSKELDSVIKIFNSLAVKQVVEGSNDQSVAFKKIFGLALSPAEQKVFVDTYLAHEDDPVIFLEKLKLQPGFTDGIAIEKTNKVLRLNLLTSNQPELTNQLFKKQQEDDELKDIRYFAKYDAADWKTQIENAGVVNFPQWVSGTTPDEKIESYATSLEQLHKQLYPTTFFAERLKKDTQSSFSLKPELDLFFSKNPDFELQTNNINKQFEQASFDAITDKEALKKELKTLNRLAKLTDNYQEVNALNSKQLYSATDVVDKYGKAQFKKEFASALGTSSNASTIYDKALSVSNKATALITAYKMRHDIKLYAIDGHNAAPENYHEMFSQHVAPEGYHQMFGDGELCECDHCQSIYSPAAYFVDILAFIKRNNEDAFNKLIDNEPDPGLEPNPDHVLVSGRRPDLNNISLSCKNTNTPLPYIDLVNELLEKEVIKTSGITDSEAITAITHSYQTLGIAAELAAMPEHVSSIAYNPLKELMGDAVFSPLLPFNLPLKEIRIYAEKLGWKKYDLMESFYGNNQPGKFDAPALAAELFGFSKEELEIIYGTPPLTVTLPETNNIRAFLDKTKLSYIELLQLLETQFLNPGQDNSRPVKIEQQPQEDVSEPLLTCNLDNLFLSGASDAWLNKLVRFVRLWKRLGWNMFDLDRALTALYPTDPPPSVEVFNNQLLISLSHIEKLHQQLNLSYQETLTLFANIDTVIYRDHAKEGQPEVASLYQQLFLNRTVINPANPALELTGLLDPHKETIGTALTLSMPDLALLLQGDESLTLEELSRLYRFSLLSKVLRIPIEKLLKIIEITGNTLANGNWTTKSLLEFLDDWHLFKTTGIGVDDYPLILTKKVGREYPLPIDTRLITEFEGHINQINEIKNNPDAVEQRRQLNERVDLIMQSFSGKPVLMEAINGNITHDDDRALKISIESYLGESNKEALLLLTADELLNKIIDLKSSFQEYLFWKSTPDFTSIITTITEHIGRLNEVKNILDAENQRNELKTRVKLIIESFTGNQLLMAAIAGNQIPNDASALKRAIGSFLGEVNKESLLLLTPIELINKLTVLKATFVEHLFWKSTPLIFKTLGFDIVKIKWLKANQADIGIDLLWIESINFEGTELYKAFKKLLCLSSLNKVKTSDSRSWTDLLDIAIKNEGAAKANFFDLFISLYQVPQSNLYFLGGLKENVNNKGVLNLNFSADFIDAKLLLEILSCSSLIDKLGGNTAQIRTLIKADSSPEDAQAARNLLKSRYNNREWLTIIKPISDKLRITRRDALVAWLLANVNEYKTPNDIYEALLIDTEMEACMYTSRIKQAISSVQLYINRCLMNLETGIELDEEFSTQWHQWRKQYRVWEANRKVFLYPENWIEPDLRDDKSPFFKELESQLKQNDVTEEIAKEALINYLEKLDTVANLEMVGLFNDEETKIVHVFGRTQNIPHQYFYRTQQNSHWSAWEKVELDIEGDHILPVVWNGRLMLFWAQFTEKQVEGSVSTSITGEIGSDMTMSSPPPVTYFEMKLAWSEYKKGKWGGKKISKENIKDISDTKKIAISSNFSDGNLLINLFTSYYDLNNFEVFTFFNQDLIYEFDNCNHAPIKFNPNLNSIKIYVTPGTLPINMYIYNWSVNTFNLFENGHYQYDSANNSVIIFNKINDFQILPDTHNSLQKQKVIFFYSDRQSVFYVRSKEKVKLEGIDADLIENNQGIISRRLMSSTNTTLSDNTPSLRSGLITGRDQQPPLEYGTPPQDPYRNYKGKRYLFETFYHPYVCDYIKLLNTKGYEYLYEEEVQQQPVQLLFNTINYNPTDLVLKPRPSEEVDFSYRGSYSLYNWELFFHIPLLIATRLSQNQKFEEARKWFHCIFDPTKPSTSEDETGSERFWITKPFKKEIREGILSLEDLLLNDENAEDLAAQVYNWEQHPFNPHAVARFRISAYMRNTVIKYMDNLIEWGDQLFRRDTIETINEATLLYILASNILGKKLEQVPARALPTEVSFSMISGQLNRFNNFKGEIESLLSPSDDADDNIQIPYFCLPKNDFLLKYWDTLADRLFKIRHCQNIEGVFRQLPLFEPPIDPALLIKANAAGLDLNIVLSDVNTVLPHYRFQIMLQKANECCSELKMLGGLLLAALEKKEGEELSLLRSGHERKMLEMIRDIKEKQKDEAKENLNSLNSSRAVVEERLNFYAHREKTNASEKNYYDSLQEAQKFLDSQAASALMASMLHMGPDFKTGAWSWGVSIGGSFWGHASTAAGAYFGHLASKKNISGSQSNLTGSFERRMDDWKFQAKTAELELKQIDKQIIAAEIRLAIAEKDLENHDLQMEHSHEVDDYMRSKFTNLELYDWMARQVSTVYFQSYQLAYTTAKRAEKCLQHELGLGSTNYIQFGYWDNLKAGLLSGEMLQFDLRRLENAYLEQNKREYEIIKHISIAMLDPLSLIKLRSTGSCEFEIPEVLYDMDHAGQYFRRLKSVSMSLPCIAGPYTSVSAKLSLMSSKFRNVPNTPDIPAYPEVLGADVRFVYNIGTIQSIATSNAQNDSGVFELNFRDERYLPFEGTGAISSWKLELPSVVKQFDYTTISDVILHVKYTAREGGDDLKEQVNASLTDSLNAIHQRLAEQGLHIAINMKDDLSNEWHLLTTNGEVSLKIDKLRLPYLAQSMNTAGIGNVMCIVRVKDNPENFEINVNEVATTLIKIDNDWNLCKGVFPGIELERVFKLAIAEADKEKLEELVMVVKYSF